MKKTIYLAIVLLSLVFSKSNCQTAVLLEESKPVVINGFEYGYSIDRNYLKKSTFYQDKDHDFEITFYVKNVSDLPYIRFIYSNGKHNICDYLAEFNCINAMYNKKEFSNFFLYAKPKMVPAVEKKYYTQYIFNVPIIYSYNSSKQVLAGYTLYPKESISAKVKISMANDELPIIKVKPYAYTF